VALRQQLYVGSTHIDGKHFHPQASFLHSDRQRVAVSRDEI
jgi:hypothetical protein